MSLLPVKESQLCFLARGAVGVMELGIYDSVPAAVDLTVKLLEILKEDSRITDENREPVESQALARFCNGRRI